MRVTLMTKSAGIGSGVEREGDEGEEGDEEDEEFVPFGGEDEGGGTQQVATLPAPSHGGLHGRHATSTQMKVKPGSQPASRGKLPQQSGSRIGTPRSPGSVHRVLSQHSGQSSASGDPASAPLGNPVGGG